MTTQSKILVYFLIKGYPLASIKFLIKQYQLETANGESNLFHRNKNAFGMSCAQTRPTTLTDCETLSDGNTNAVFSSVWSSIKDRWLWDVYFNIDKKSPSYGVLVSEIYHPNAFYFTNVNTISNKVYETAFMIFVQTGLILASICYFLNK
jgi:hypothetical protein